MKAAIYGRAFKTAQTETIQRIFSKLEFAKVELMIHEQFHKNMRGKVALPKSFSLFSLYEEIKSNVDFLFSIGGDGTLLETLTLVRDSGIPVIGINTGRLGFLSSISKEEIDVAVDAVIKKKFSIDKRTLIRLETKSKLFGKVNYALNEITLHKKDASSMIKIHATVNGKFLNSYFADGLIIATPTGSTAYSLSCGGPIVVPSSQNFIITPVAPHNLNVRPIVISDTDIITLKVEGRNRNFLVSLDSRSAVIDASTELTIRKEKFVFNLVKLGDHDCFSTFRNKLMWGLDKRN